jgi:fatty acid desaturase
MFLRSLLAVPILLVPAIAGLPEGWAGLFAGLGIWFLLNDMNFLLHQHVHRPWTHSSFLNRTLDLLLSVVTGMSACNWRLTHLQRHHKGDDSWGKGFAWEIDRASFVGAVSYSVRGIPIVFFYPIFESFYRGFIRRTTGLISYRWAFAEQLFVTITISSLIVVRPEFYVPYYFCVLFFSRLTDYQNHVGCDERSEYGFSNNTLNPCYNWVRYNFGFHTAHHYFPDAHWTELPELHSGMASGIPQERIGSRPWTGLYTPPLIAWWICAQAAAVLRGRATSNSSVAMSVSDSTSVQ